MTDISGAPPTSPSIQERLRASAQKALPKATCKWDAMEAPHYRADEKHLQDGGIWGPLATYIALADPRSVLSLLDHIDQLKSALRRTVDDLHWWHIRNGAVSERRQCDAEACVTASRFVPELFSDADARALLSLQGTDEEGATPEYNDTNPDLDDAR